MVIARSPFGGRLAQAEVSGKMRGSGNPVYITRMGFRLRGFKSRNTKESYMSQASAGNKIAIHYTGTLADGSVFDSSEGRDPLSFTMGEGQIIPGLETALDGMAEGEEKTVTVPADDAYGHKNPQAMQRVPRSSVPDGIPLDLGTQLQLQTPEGQAMPVTVAEVTESEVVLDANHPLAGKDLTFAVKVVSVD